MLSWKNRQTLKHARQLAHAAAKMLRINRDVLDPRRQQEISAACASLRTAIATRDPASIPALSDRLENLLERNFPRPKNAGMRENVEVFLVAAIVAMGVRTFFIQPFKIPTGSMQPTLYGIIEDPAYNRNASLPIRLADVMFRGIWPTSPTSSTLESVFDFAGWVTAGRCPVDARFLVRGDHILVDKLSYHFRKPKRGDVVVFDTTHIMDLPPWSRGQFYIKRLIGLAGDELQIQPPHVLVNTKILDERRAFQRIYSQQGGYDGYYDGTALERSSLKRGLRFSPPTYFRTPDDTYRVPPRSFFVLGDNTQSSLDGRYWGSVPEPDLVGRALWVYWPFSARVGPID